MIYGLYFKKTKEIFDIIECLNILQLNIINNLIGYIKLNKKFDLSYSNYIFLVNNNRIIKIKKRISKKINRKQFPNILSYIKHLLWKLTFDFYCGNTNRNNYNNRLTKTDTDIYMLGILNYYRKKDGKLIIGDIVINPDNEYMLANLAWGQKIWKLYYLKINQIKLMILNTTENIEIDLTQFKLDNIPYSLSDILLWLKNNQD